MSINKNISTNELYQKLTEYIDKKFEEQRTELREFLLPIETKCKQLEERVISLERKIRKNNVVIFGMNLENGVDLLEQVLDKLNTILQTNISHKHVNDIYRIGQKNTIVLEFLSKLTKTEIFENIKKLKGTGISIANDLCKEDQQDKQILYNNLKSAKTNNLKAYIKNNRLYVNNKSYTVDQLKNNPAQIRVNFEDSPQSSGLSNRRERPTASQNQEEENTETGETSVRPNQLPRSEATELQGGETIQKLIKVKDGRDNNESGARNLRIKPKK